MKKNSPLQLYQVHSLETAHEDFPQVDFNEYQCIMFPGSLQSAKLICTHADRPTYGFQGMARIFPGNKLPIILTSICYSIFGWRSFERHGVFQPFQHEFKRRVFLTSNMEIKVCDGGSLFKTNTLNFLLETKELPGMHGIQFIA